MSIDLVQGSRKRILLTSWVAFCLCMLSFAARAQVDQGAVTGTVVDQQGAVIPNANVTVTDLGTALKLETKTDQRGVYVFSPLKIGHYSIVASAPGFTATNITDLQLQVNQRLGLNITLRVGAATQSVDVSASSIALMQTEDASSGHVFDSQTINNTPLSGRNYVFLAQLTAGVNQGQQGARNAGSGDFSANGQRTEQNNFILDGVDNNSNLTDFLNGASYVVNPPPDALQEFKIQTSNYSAELGHSAGAVINASIKSGTNSFHGSVWEYFQNDALNTITGNNYFSRKSPELRYNQFGATFGGPIWKNKLFFFGDYQGLRQISASSSGQYTVPTDLMRQGNFTELLQSTLTNNNNRKLYNEGGPAAGTGGASNFLSCNGQVNVICPSQVDAVAKKLLAAFPEPNFGIPGQTYNNYIFNGHQAFNPNQFDVRSDWNISNHDQTFARYSFQDQPKFSPSPFGVLDGAGFGGSTVINQSRSFAFSETHQFTDKFVNELRYGYNWNHSAFYQAGYNQAGLAESFGLGGLLAGPNLGGIPGFSVGGISSFGASGYEPSNEHQNVWQISDNITRVVGNHSLHFGVYIQSLRVATLQPNNGIGNVNFSGKFTQDPNNQGQTGFGVADLLLNQMTSSALSNITTTNNIYWVRAGYVQDDWKATSRLTINAGLRYEYTTPARERNDQMGNFRPNVPVLNYNPSQNITGGTYLLPSSARNNPLPANLLANFAKDGVVVQYTDNHYLVAPDYTNFAPRVGLAYSIDDKTVIRGAYGIFYGALEGIGYSLNLGVNPPFAFNSNFNSAGCAYGSCPTNGQTLETGWSTVLAQGIIQAANSPNLNGSDDVKTPYSQQFNLSIQRSFGSSLTATVGYVGATTHHLQTPVDPNNQALPVGPGDNSQAARPYPDLNYGSYIVYGSDANYNSLQAKLDRRFSKGLQFAASYTLAHSLDDSRQPLSDASNGIDYRNARQLGLSYDYGSSYQDVRNRVTLTGGYELPFGYGKQWMNRKGIVDIFAGGWTANIAFSAQTGQPFSIQSSNNSTGGVGRANAVRVADPFKPGGTPGPGLGFACATKTRTLQTWFNPCAFVNPPVAVDPGKPLPNPLPPAGVVSIANAGAMAAYGPRGRTLVDSPGFNKTDLSLVKTFHFYRETGLKVRGDIFNVLNTPAYGQPNNYPGSSNFGQITSVNSAGRTVQLSGDFSF
jgi:Carboxypeptidase regulatory-like domain/TonB dependent receptor